MPTENNGPSKGNKMFIIKAPFRWRVFKELRADSELTLSNPWSQVRKVGFHIQCCTVVEKAVEGSLEAYSFAFLRMNNASGM